MKCYNCESKKLVCDNEIDAYVCQDCGYEHYKQYFFISHSHQDIEKVRIIRNVIEETFFYEPILFFLKCLSDKTEVESLIKREIDERIWFVYCKSKNAEKSEYVRMEREYIQNRIEEGHKIRVLEIDIDKYEIWDNECYDYIRNQIAYKVKKANVYVSYSHRDEYIARKILRQLKQNNFTTFADIDISAGSSWFDESMGQIKKHSYINGVILLICSENSMRSNFVSKEIEEALRNNAFIIPVIIYDETNSIEKLSSILGNISPSMLDHGVFGMSYDTFKEDVEKLIKYLLEY